MELTGKLPLAAVLDLLVDAVCIVDADGRFVSVSAAGENIFGYTAEEMIGRQMIDMVHPDDREKTLWAADEVIAGVNHPNFENRYVRKDGQSVHIMWTARWSPDHQLRVAVARDVSARKHAESLQAALYAISEAAFSVESLDALFARIHTIVDRLLPASGFFVALHDAQENRLSFPYHFDEVDPAPPTGSLDSGFLSTQVIRSAEALLLNLDPQDTATRRRESDVGEQTQDWLGAPLISPSGVIGALVVKNHSSAKRYTPADTELLKFVSAQVAAAIERKQTESQLRHVARHDPLTGLPNRTLIFDRITTALARGRRARQRVSLLYLDLDQFKQVNDSYGHLVGDLLLQEVAQRLKRAVRESDTVGRMAGDEFIVLLGCIADPPDACPVAEKIRLSLCQPFEIDGNHLLLTPSIGISHYPDHAETCDQLIDQADKAMYKAKHQGGNRCEVSANASAESGQTTGQRTPSFGRAGPDQAVESPSQQLI